MGRAWKAATGSDGLGGKFTIRDRISVLATKGYVKFLRDGSLFGYPMVRSRYGYLCVEGMQFSPSNAIDEVTGEIIAEPRAVLPSHYKCPHSGVCLEVENPSVWVYPEGGESELGPQDCVLGPQSSLGPHSNTFSYLIQKED